ncbi:tyrosine-type recombinase/integrase [Winogradskyella pulchriflava]|uniref:Tyrosine-type recombinase/integrase n=1 Tax=Winogradskyella pulchriflava TaxID=1110688 RepID=A0ABV6QEQ9_9FLAO
MKTKTELIELYKLYISLSCTGKTIYRYTRIIELFFNTTNDPYNATYGQVLKFVSGFKSISAKKQAQGALMHFYKGVIPKPGLIVRLPKIKSAQALPEILSEKEIALVLSNISNLKHKAIISTIYFNALRISEVINLHINHINGSNRTLHIKFSKGAKSRIIPFSKDLHELLRSYYKKYRPKAYLFEGQAKPRYNASSIRKILQRALDKSNISRKITPHCLRHSRATHLLSNGMDIKLLSEFLGHSKLETTERYIHLKTSDLMEAIMLADNRISSKIAA